MRSNSPLCGGNSWWLIEGVEVSIWGTISEKKKKLISLTRPIFVKMFKSPNKTLFIKFLVNRFTKNLGKI